MSERGGEGFLTPAAEARLRAERDRLREALERIVTLYNDDEQPSNGATLDEIDIVAREALAASPSDKEQGPS